MTDWIPVEMLSPWAWGVLGVLAVVSVFAATASCYKVFHFMRLGVGRRGLPNQIVDRWLTGSGAGALELAEKRSSARVRVLFAALSALDAQPGDRAYAEALATQVALDEITDMEKGLRAIEAAVQAAPMPGLLGTVVGITGAF